MASATTQRFTAVIGKQGPNPCIDVPREVVEAFAEHMHAGRIAVEGVLNGGTPIRATLIPVGRGGHQLYVNGGMRAAAHVGVGDRVTFELRAVDPEEVTPSADVLAGFQASSGAAEAFAQLPPSHRRELLRFIDDARTPHRASGAPRRRWRTCWGRRR